MKLPYWGIFICILSLTVQPAFSQESQAEGEPEEKVDRKVKNAYEAYEAEEYNEAIELLKKALSEVRGREKKTEVLFMIAESYRHILDYRNAENFYNKAVKLGYKDDVAMLRYADMLKAQGEYEDAIAAYREYKEKNPQDERAEIGIESAKQAVEWQNEPSRYEVEIMPDINDKSLDMTPIFGGKRGETNEIIFASARDESTGSREDGWTGQEFTDLYVASAERKSRRRRRRGGDDEGRESLAEKKWSTPVLLDEEDMINTKYNEGAATFDSRKKELYFTRCMQEKNMKLGCGIYVTQEQGTTWRQPERIIIGTDTMANVGHPSLSPDDEILYFVSDDYNSTGGHDIFMTTYDRRADIWRTPKNLGPKVNTLEEEYFPFAHDDGYLYFASNGLPGMGGLDVFRIKLGEDGMPANDAEVENMKYPINTNFEDYGLVFAPGGDELGFVTSNRKSKSSLDDDIYAVVKVPLTFNLEGVVTSSKTGEPIQQASVKLEGSDGSSFVVNTDKDGYYIFEEEAIEKDVQYELSFEKDKFLTNTGNVTTVGVPLNAFEYIPSDNQYLNIIRLNRELDPIEEPIVLPNVFFDLGKAKLRDESKQALDSVVMILERNPSIVIELRSHTDYRDSEQSNLRLSQRRADSSVTYLIEQGIDSARLVPRGMGEGEPFVIPQNYTGYGAGQFEPGTELTETFIKSLPPAKFEVANQINRRTDIKVLRDDYVPAGASQDGGVNAADIIEEKREEANAPGEIYILKERESFGTVARRFNLSITDIKRLNNGLRGVRPFEGLQLKVTPDGNYEQWDATHYQVQRRGQSMKDVAEKLEMDDDTLEDLNPDLDKRDLPVGYWLLTKEK